MIYAAESVFPGHPDKLCDALADALVEWAAAREKRALCAIEVAVHRGSVFVTGRLACEGSPEAPLEDLARTVYREAGYSAGWIPAPEELRVQTDLCLDSLAEGESAFRACSDDQSIVTGYAVDCPATNWLPPEHWLVCRLSRRLQKLRLELPELGLGPDGKIALLFDDEERQLSAFTGSLQQRIGRNEIEFVRAVRDAVGDELRQCARAWPELRPEVPTDFRVNGVGNFEVGGPEGDNGLSGKKLVVDGYGPRVPIGGGALSGKDFFKPDRAGALLARRLAKLVVASGTAAECTATLAIFGGERKFRIVSLRAEDGHVLAPERWESLIDLSLEAAGERYALTTGLPQLARFGHFTAPDRPWEEIRV